MKTKTVKKEIETKNPFSFLNAIIKYNIINIKAIANPAKSPKYPKSLISAIFSVLTIISSLYFTTISSGNEDLMFSTSLLIFSSLSDFSVSENSKYSIESLFLGIVISSYIGTIFCTLHGVFSSVIAMFFIIERSSSSKLFL